MPWLVQKFVSFGPAFDSARFKTVGSIADDAFDTANQHHLRQLDLVWSDSLGVGCILSQDVRPRTCNGVNRSQRAILFRFVSCHHHEGSLTSAASLAFSGRLLGNPVTTEGVYFDRTRISIQITTPPRAVHATVLIQLEWTSHLCAAGSNARTSFSWHGT